ncbi:hypothetical protein O9K51_03343 [Purpureocillium lavendulum]|uniref:Uncharacterized protein n=1 Tax=Purpureocillium lavendulum TaxID=1247861 RepID=A0AB34G2Y4_9HYPO|nr:hypothetical protein O9K51_03343 [Purpureocillium lavendulum]
MKPFSSTTLALTAGSVYGVQLSWLASILVVVGLLHADSAAAAPVGIVARTWGNYNNGAGAAAAGNYWGASGARAYGNYYNNGYNNAAAANYYNGVSGARGYGNYYNYGAGAAAAGNYYNNGYYGGARAYGNYYNSATTASAYGNPYNDPNVNPSAGTTPGNTLCGYQGPRYVCKGPGVANFASGWQPLRRFRSRIVAAAADPEKGDADTKTAIDTGRDAGGKTGEPAENGGQAVDSSSKAA